MRTKTLLLFVITLAVLFGCASKDEGAGAERKTAPNFTLQDLDGKNVRLSDFKGKVILLDFWATWCAPCRASIPGLEHLHKTYGGKGLVVLGISLDYGGWDSVKSFQTEYGITYPILKGSDDVAIKYRVHSIPMLILTDKEGKIRNRFLGYAGEEDIEKEIKPLL